MRKLILILLCFISLQVSGRAFYVSATGNDGASGLTQATAWRTIAKVNSAVYLAGDSILFRRGDVFDGSIIPNRNTLTYDAYGSGNLPVINGFYTPTSFVNDGGGIYSFVLPRLTKNPLNLVSINNVPQQVARYPDITESDGGFLSSDPLTPTDTSTIVKLSSGYIPAINDEFILRTKKWREVKVKVTATPTGQIRYARTPGLTEGGSNVLEPPDQSSGYFFTRKLSYLTQFGEWYLNPTTRRVSIYFGAANPLSYSVKASVVDSLMNIGSRTFITVNNLKFVGGNTYAINCVLGSNITIDNCVADNMGCKGFGLNSVQNTTITNCITDHCLESGITSYGNSKDNATIRFNTVKHSGLIPGMGSFNHPEDYAGITAIARTNLLVDQNYILATGMDAIFWQGSNVLIQHNIIDSFCMTVQDHGGIYSFTETTPVKTNRVIYANFISNGVGNFYGTNLAQLMASGIYNDGATMNVLEYGNTIYNLPRSAVTSNDPLGMVIRDNTAFNTVRGYSFLKGTRRDSINISILNNIAYNFATTSGGSQQNIYQEYYTNTDVSDNTSWQEAIARSGNIDSNYFSLATITKWRVEVYNPNFAQNMTFANWQLNTGKDLHSTVVADVTINNVLFLKNPSSANYPYYLNGNYVDVRGVSYSRDIVLQPWTSLILFYVSPLPPIPPGTPVKMKFKVSN